MCRLFEHDVAADVNPLSCRVVDAICLGARLVADEDGPLAAVIQLLQIGRCHLHVRHTPKGAQVLNTQNVPIPELVWSPAACSLA